MQDLDQIYHSNNNLTNDRDYENEYFSFSHF